MRLHKKAPKISRSQIAQRVLLSNGSAYYCVTVLIDKRYLKLRNFEQSNSKENYLYELTPRGIGAKTQLEVKFLELKRQKHNNREVGIFFLETELGFDDNQTSGKAI